MNLHQLNEQYISTEKNKMLVIVLLNTFFVCDLDIDDRNGFGHLTLESTYMNWNQNEY